MIALDTNVLARAILRDDEVQSPQAIKVIKDLAANDGILITSSVLLELVWVLRKKKHPSEIYEIVQHLLESEGITFVNASLVGEALEVFRHGKIDFGDAMLVVEAQAHGVMKVMTFDEALLKADKRAVSVS